MNFVLFTSERVYYDVQERSTASVLTACAIILNRAFGMLTRILYMVNCNSAASRLLLPPSAEFTDTVVNHDNRSGLHANRKLRQDG